MTIEDPWKVSEEDFPRSGGEATLERHCELWERGHGVRVSVATMSRAVRGLGWTYKQNTPALSLVCSRSPDAAPNVDGELERELYANN